MHIELALHSKYMTYSEIGGFGGASQFGFGGSHQLTQCNMADAVLGDSA
jgi:hypothetical protein